MTVTIQIRELDESVRDRLKARAAQDGESFNSYLKRLLAREAEKPTQQEVFARVRSRSESASVPAADLIRAERDARAAGAAPPSRR
ncbi:MAG TPA: hypothetical protein PLA46_03295 [Phycicoccus sp.]|nr:hypothetical protein [Phycicoccus sp.]HQH07212.1 hypothetical protein [Phycicoccus sp.]HQK31210.1 hypothetical protein [Phycicoccus sp.]HQV90581.1 hypothetical protein [Phycicoccus sp.]HQY97458.1 hypothetical protein [Phycicoccus sp.]